ncbi:sigma-54 dependent transcriptional regulator [Solidesulfovibrio sp.]|uniref:sigma-54-dependent transcriptional regulator n=1 Tax=Solidesulfovibrio sp. TaxID=2910990 RepID=UPI002B20222B|nr:sigma-54 dependent transcriptional regulator [Solidesulfovibrio sp.]MEA4856219.1 sigma-54 dependent transcriptional regulator [Solidesulfovibrio sp.]
MAQILIVDDDHQLRMSFERLLAAEGYDVRAASSGEAGIDAVREAMPDVVVMDVRMPGISGLEAYAAMREIEPRLPVIIMTAYGTTDMAIEATKMGAYDYILKPFDIPETLRLIDKAVAAARSMRARVAVGEEDAATAAADAIIGKSPAMQELYKAIGRAAPTDATVLVRGESGTGKELVARAVYQHSNRADKPFLVINCVAIPETLLESELFGYEKGAFTGASGRKVGKIEQANHGTVFLDEIGDMPLPIQAKILRLLQEQNVERLGGRQVIPVDVRIIAATNRDLEEAVRRGQFREDLYYRLKVVTLSMPPLRERPGDIALLVRYFLSRFAKDMGQVDPGVSPAALEFLTAQPWPGTVRDLGTTVKKALIFNLGAPLGLDEVRKALGQPLRNEAGSQAEAGEALSRLIRRELASGRESLFEDLMDRFGQQVIREALDATGGNRTQAARLLGLSRPTLLAKIEKYGQRIESRVRPADS